MHLRNMEGETEQYVVARREKNHYIKEAHDKKLFKFLIGKGLDLLVEDGAGRSALDAAAPCRKGEILEHFRYNE